MQVLFLPHWLMVLLFFLLWPLFHIGAAALCFYLPDSAFARDGWLYKTRGWEVGGALYERVFRIKKWKRYLPDGGAWFKGGYAKKHIRNFGAQNLDTFLLESCRAELTHWLAIVPFWVFGLFAPWYIVPIMLAYALAANLPCILTQRYNRPRVQKLLARQTATVAVAKDAQTVAGVPFGFEVGLQ